MREGQGFQRAGRAAPRDFPRAKSKGNLEGQLCRLEENPVLADSFAPIFIIFIIDFLIGPPKCIDSSVLTFLKFTDGSVLALLKCVDSYVLAHLRFPSIFSHQISADGEFC